MSWSFLAGARSMSEVGEDAGVEAPDMSEELDIPLGALLLGGGAMAVPVLLEGLPMEVPGLALVSVPVSVLWPHAASVSTALARHIAVSAL